MKIGDKVRFLSEVGGGRICGFQAKDIVLVEDEDGFQIPMLRSQVVLVDDSEYDIGKVHTLDTTKSKKTEKSDNWKSSDAQPLDSAPVTGESLTPYSQKPLERRGADSLNLYLSFLPDNIKESSTTGFEAYLVNDSNYYVQVLYLSAEGTGWKARFNAVVEPNSKIFVEEFDHSTLGQLEHICVQAFAWKQDKVFGLKPAISTEMRLDCTKFYKLHVFRPDIFFNEPCWTVQVIKDDKPVRTAFPDAEQIKEALLGAKPYSQRSARADRMGRLNPPKPSEEVVINLHAEELLDTSAGLSSGDILMVQMNEFRRVMDENISHTGKKIVFIHGKGEGVLRKNIIQELKYRYKHCTWQDASFREYGYGATLVKIGTQKQTNQG